MADALREAQIARRDELLDNHKRWLVNEAGHTQGFQDIDSGAILEQWPNARFKYSALERDLRENAKRMGLREAITSSQMAGTISLTMVHEMMDDYTAYAPVYRGLAEETTSNSIQDIYDEEWQDDQPVRLDEQQEAPESRQVGGQIAIMNHEYGRMLAIPKRLFDRDQLGRAKRIARNFGKRFEEVKDKEWVFMVFRTLQTSNIGNGSGQVPATNVAGNAATGITTTAGAITPARIMDGLSAPAYMLDPFGLRLTFEPDTVLVDTADRFKTQGFINSINWPVAPPASPGIQTPSSYAINPLHGLLTMKWSQWVGKARAGIAESAPPWALLKAGSGFVLQTVHDLEVTQEDPNAGDSFNTRTYRWQALIEFGKGPRNPRLGYVGN